MEQESRIVIDSDNVDTECMELVPSSDVEGLYFTEGGLRSLPLYPLHELSGYVFGAWNLVSTSEINCLHVDKDNPGPCSRKPSLLQGYPIIHMNFFNYEYPLKLYQLWWIWNNGR